MFVRTRYGLHQEAVNLCKSSTNPKWKDAIMWVFDVPTLQVPFEVIIQTVLTLILYIRKDLNILRNCNCLHL